MKFTRMHMKVLSFILALSMLLTLCTPVAWAVDDGNSVINQGSGGSSTPAPADNVLNYVSIGDSMTNGYGFDGYNQGNKDDLNGNGHYDDDYNFFEDRNVYGAGSYALQFEEYLTGKGYNVTHTKLASSALRAEDLLYLLGGRDMPTDGWFEQVLYYTDAGQNGKRGDAGDCTPEAIEHLSNYYQTAITEADIMTLCIGNASFGAYLLSRISSILMGGQLNENEMVTLEDALTLLESEDAKQIVLDSYADFKEKLAPYLAMSGFDPAQLDAALGIFAYTVAGFLLNYEGVIDRIVELNPDVEIILIGLMNTTYGMNVTDDGFEFAFGDMMDEMFGMLNAYIAGVPATKQLVDETYADASFYYAEQPAPEFIVLAFDELAAENWNDIDCGDKNCVACIDKDPTTMCENGRLSGSIVRSRQIDAYNGELRIMIGDALGFELPAITLADVENYVFLDLPEDYDTARDQYQITLAFFEQTAQYNGTNAADLPLVARYIAATQDFYLAEAWSKFSTVFKADIEKEISIAIYMALEESIAMCVDTMDVTVDGLMGIASGNPMTALGAMPEALNPANNPGPYTIKNALVGWFTGSETGRAMVKVYALFKVGDGMSVHPTPTAHDNLYEAVVGAYEAEYTATQQTIENLKELAIKLQPYYNDAFAIAYQKAVETGVIAEMNGYLDTIEGAIDEAQAWMLQNAHLISNQALIEKMADAIYNARVSLAQARALINNPNQPRAAVYARSGAVAAAEPEQSGYQKTLNLLLAISTNVNDVAELAAAITEISEELSGELGSQLDEETKAAIADLVVIAENLDTKAVTESLTTVLADAAVVLEQTMPEEYQILTEIVDVKEVIVFVNENSDAMSEVLGDYYDNVLEVLPEILPEILPEAKPEEPTEPEETEPEEPDTTEPEETEPAAPVVPETPIRDAIDNLVNAGVDKLETLGNQLLDQATVALQSAADQVIAQATEEMKNLGEQALSQATEAMDIVLIQVTEEINNVLDQAMEELKYLVGEELFNQATAELESTANQAAAKLENATNQAATELGNAVSAELEKAANQATTELENAANQATTELENAANQAAADLENAANQAAAQVTAQVTDKLTALFNKFAW